MERPITVPLAQQHTNQCHVTPPWFVQCSEYNLLPGTFQLLINGENAFGALYEALTNARKSISIICWGFQPSMYLVRNDGGKSLRIGELLEAKGQAGIKVRVLSWAMEINVPATLDAKVSVTGTSGEANLPGRRGISWKDQPATMSKAQFDYDQEWFMRYDREQSMIYDKGTRSIAGLDGKARTNNVHFMGRGFDASDRDAIFRSQRADPKTGTLVRTAQAASASHHQKMVLIDFEDPANAVAFVMGHNLLDEYWDGSHHSYKQHDNPREGRNGSRPRHDISSCVRGPMLGDLFHNLNTAWKKETGEDLQKSIGKAVFEKYPLSLPNREQKGNDSPSEASPVAEDNKATMGQILRTQPQYGIQDIKTCYLQAINNASQYIYIENQYFRWPLLAEKIKTCATGQSNQNRKPEVHGPLYLFVITNADKEGVGLGSDNTARMLESLGRADAMPGISRDVRAEDNDTELSATRQEIAREKFLQNQQKSMLDSRYARPKDKADLAASQERVKVLEAKEAELKAKRAAQTKSNKDKTPLVPEERPNLKVHLCTLVSPDSPGRSGSTALTPDGQRAMTRDERIAQAEKKRDEAIQNISALRQQGGNGTRIQAEIRRRDEAEKELKDLKDGSNPIDWVEVYIHAKLMLIDDTFMTVGSANINSRSMETDSELNIAHANHLITQPMRRELWNLHTGGKSGGEAFDKEGMKQAYKFWGDVMTRNKERRLEKKSPIASLVEFYSGTQDRRDLD